MLSAVCESLDIDSIPGDLVDIKMSGTPLFWEPRISAGTRIENGNTDSITCQSGPKSVMFVAVKNGTDPSRVREKYRLKIRSVRKCTTGRTVWLTPAVAKRVMKGHEERSISEFIAAEQPLQLGKLGSLNFSA